MTTETQISLQLSKVLNGVYQKLKSEARVVKEFGQAYVQWSSSTDVGKGRTHRTYFHFDGFIAELSPQSGVFVTRGDLGLKDDFDDFYQAVILTKIYLGEMAKQAEEVRWGNFHYGPQTANWDEVTLDFIGAILPTHKFHPFFTDPTKVFLPAVYITRDRLILNKTEIANYIAVLPEYSSSFAYRDKDRGINFILGHNQNNASGYLKSDEVRGILTPAKYHPEVIDFITRQLQQKTGINQPRLI